MSFSSVSTQTQGVGAFFNKKNEDSKQEKLLSRAGKEVLIKAVSQSIPTYTMGVFQLPVKLCNELNAMCARF